MGRPRRSEPHPRLSSSLVVTGTGPARGTSSVAITPQPGSAGRLHRLTGPEAHWGHLADASARKEAEEPV
ncbi:hypothetical protein AB0E78_12105 [Streptomyces sp. NPDC032198]|uniref:hypothetical protein n=1 Tax=Streptomyces sp. NPDC032198 TaxID=3155127 RepID=UPI0033D9A8EE